MISLKPGELIAIFVAIIGAYGFTFLAWRNISNHVYSKLDEIEKSFNIFCKDVTDRLARIETRLDIERKE